MNLDWFEIILSDVMANQELVDVQYVAYPFWDVRDEKVFANALRVIADKICPSFVIGNDCCIRILLTSIFIVLSSLLGGLAM